VYPIVKDVIALFPNLHLRRWLVDSHSIKPPAVTIASSWLPVIDGVTPDTYDVIGGLIALLGIYIIMYWPR
jgi:hypothetical protein